MKKRSMLAIASLATGFVVAAITPSHALSGNTLSDPDVKDTLSSVDHAVDTGDLGADEGALGIQNG
ncbi:hypothetical protein ACWC3X_08665 [Streptomyces populi]